MMGRLKGGYLGGSTIIRAWPGGPQPEMTAAQRRQARETPDEKSRRLAQDKELQAIMLQNDRRIAESKGDYGTQAVAKAKRKKWKRPKPRAPQILLAKLALNRKKDPTK